MTRVADRPNPHAFGGRERFGIFLDGGKAGEILMPQKYVPEGTQPGDDVPCFVYLDQDERPIATSEEPLAQVGDFAYLSVNWVNDHGAFLNWGVMKDLFCPFREQKKTMEMGDSYIVYVHIDEESYRIVASAKVDKFLSDFNDDYDSEAPAAKGQDMSAREHAKRLVRMMKQGEPVDLLVWQKSPLGFKVIVDNRYPGLIYEDQVFRYVHTGDRLKGYVQNIRNDGKIDVALQPTGRKQTEDFAETLLQWLRDNGGTCPLGDKSDPEDIKRTFQVSKKVYKKAIGDLYKRHLITIQPDGIKLA